MDSGRNSASPKMEPSSRGLPEHDYVSPNLDVIIPDTAFPNMRVGDTRIPQWTWLRKWVPHNWYIDKDLPHAGFASRDEVAIIYNTALKFRGRPCLEVGCWRGWSTVHFALGAGSLYVIDPVIDDPEFAASIQASCAAAGVLDKIEFHAGYSPGAIDELSQRLGIKWSLMFVDAEHEGDAPKLDAEAALRNAADDALVLFHDLSSPFVAAALNTMREAGWRTMLYQTMQIMGVAWRGNVEPVQHIPDPNVFWTLPKHLAGYEVSGWKPYRLPHEGRAWWPGMTLEEHHHAAMMLAQSKEDRLVEEILAHDVNRRELGRTTEQLSKTSQNLEKSLSDLDFATRNLQILKAEYRQNLDQVQFLVGRLLNERTAAVELRSDLLGRLSEQRKDYRVLEAQLLHLMQHSEIELSQAKHALVDQAQRFTLATEENEHRKATQQYVAASLSAQAATLRAVLGLLRRTSAERNKILHNWSEMLELSELGSEDLSRRLSQTRAILGLLRRSFRSREALIFQALIRAISIPTPNHLMSENLAPKDLNLPEILHNRDDDTSAADAQLISLSAAWFRLATGADPRSFGAIRRYFDEVKIQDERLVAWVKRITFDPSVGDNQYLLSHSLTTIRESELWDPNFYREIARLSDDTIDPALHYLLVGEALGLPPSEHFDPRYYGQRSADVLAGGMCLFAHYINHGAKEGRLPRAPQVVHEGAVEWDVAKPNVIIVSHESSRTGAPILAWNIAKILRERYNVFAVLLGGGAIVPDFYSVCSHVCGPFPRGHRSQIDLRFGLAEIFARYDFKYAIINSTESRVAFESCFSNLVPTLFLVHEFGTYVYPRAELTKAFDLADELVFPAPIVARSSISIHSPLVERSLNILPQGRSDLPPSPSKPKDKSQKHSDFDLVAERKKQGCFIVLGAGTVSMRKGVDLFISAAASALKTQYAPKMHFVWIGQGYRPQEDMNYSIYLLEQMERAGIIDQLTFLEETPDLDRVYGLADAFLLTSRLDPLPNVSIDAAWKGIPTICFENASGMADLLAQDQVTAPWVVPHLDVQAVSDALLRLAGSSALHEEVSTALIEFAQRTFDMKRYVMQLDELGSQHARDAQGLRDAAKTISSNDGFSPDFFTGAEHWLEDREESARRYVAMWHQREHVSTWLRRPAPGFNGFAWLAGSRASRSTGSDPYAEFLKVGRPCGPWQLPVLQHLPLRGSMSAWPLRDEVALVHVYSDSAECFSQTIARLSSAPAAGMQLIVSGPECVRDELTQILEKAGIVGTVLDAELRDALSLAAFMESHVNRFSSSLIAHLLATSSQKLVNWRDYHWEHVVGGRLAAAEKIADAFGRDESLGLVFPAEPYYPVWDSSTHESVSYLAAAISEGQQFEEVWDYPEGGMFWARREVLQKLLEVSSNVENVHSLAPGHVECLLPAVSRAAGFGVAVVTSLGVDW